MGSDALDYFNSFLYGGFSLHDNNSYNDAWILSLPAFVWHRVDDAPGGAREWLNYIAVGNRQVLSVGGINGNFSQKDPAPNGLQLVRHLFPACPVPRTLPERKGMPLLLRLLTSQKFDMTALAWAPSYNANASPYERSDAIKNIYKNWSPSDMKWSAEEQARQ